MSQLVLRKIVELSIDDQDTELLLPEQLIVAFPARRKGQNQYRDLGSLCFESRSKFRSGKSITNSQRLVDIDSLDTTRRTGLKRYYDFIRNQWALHRSSSLIDRLTINACRYVDFCDGLIEPTKIPVFSKASLAIYVRWLIDRTNVAKNVDSYVALNTARSYQAGAINFLTIAMKAPESELISGIKLIKRVPRSMNSTLEPDEEHLAFAIKCHYALFMGLSTLILNKQNFPYSIDMPDQKLYCLPDPTCYFASKKARSQKKAKNITFNYDDGRLFNEQDVVANLKPKTSKWHSRIRCLERAQNAIKKANNDLRSKERVMFANVACQAFYMLFIANSGVNDQVARDLLWNEKCSIVDSSGGWRGLAIKNRGAVEVQAEISSKFKRTFDRYIKLRAWLVNKREADFLFMCERKDGTLEPFDNAQSAAYKARLKANYPEMSWITPRELRKHKGVYILRKSNGNVYTASQVLGNTPSTIERHYSDGNLTVASQEFAALWKSIRKKKFAHIRNLEIEPKKVSVLSLNQGYTDTPVGACLEHMKPERSQEFTDKTITPNCLRAEGCLFCQHFAIHSNKEDIHKLVSCKYVLSSLRPVFDNEEHFLAEYGVIISRIDEVLTQISNKGQDEFFLISKVKHEVNELGKLNDYWQRRLDMLIQMEVKLDLES